MSLLVVCIYSFLCLFMSQCYADRKLTIQINPNCGSFCDSNNTTELYYVKAVGSSDTLHYLWSTYGGISMLIARTNQEAVLHVSEDYYTLNSHNSIYFDEKPYETSSVIFTKLYEYNDKNDDVDISSIPFDQIIPHNTSTFNWEGYSVINNSDHSSVTFSSNYYGPKSVQISFTAFGSEGYPDQLPSLKHSTDSFQLDIVIDNFNTSYNTTRFAVEFFVFEDKNDQKFELEKQKTIDDEYTPGVFLTYNMKTSNDGPLFLHWKPVCYTSNDRTTEDSTDTIQQTNTNIKFDKETEINSSLAYAYYGNEIDETVYGRLNVSFGLQEDKFYQHTNFITWTVLMGRGALPEDKFSTLVIIVIIVGFGIPALLILSGGIYIIVKRCRREEDAYSSMDDKSLTEEGLIN